MPPEGLIIYILFALAFWQKMHTGPSFLWMDEWDVPKIEVVGSGNNFWY